MTGREKTLAGVGGFTAMVFVTYLAASRLFLGPAADCLKQADDVQANIDRAEAAQRQVPVHQAHLVALAARSFGSDELRVSERMRAVVTHVVTRSGLGTQNLSLKPLVGTRLPGVYREIAWSIRVRGELDDVVNFMYLMAREPHLHRLDNVVLTPAGGSPGQVDLQARCASLVLESPKGERLATDAGGDMPMDARLLQASERSQYEVIAARDLFRPYIQRRSRTEAGAQEARSPSAETPPPGDRLVGLPTWDGKTDILVWNDSAAKVVSYKPGDELAGGKIILVDYRPMPLAKKPEILSPSRVVIRIGAEYYAVELGQNLSEKRPLAESEWPPGLPRLPMDEGKRVGDK